MAFVKAVREKVYLKALLTGAEVESHSRHWNWRQVLQINVVAELHISELKEIETSYMRKQNLSMEITCLNMTCYS